jgi:hypothetical protein
MKNGKERAKCSKCARQHADEQAERICHMKQAAAKQDLANRFPSSPSPSPCPLQAIFEGANKNPDILDFTPVKNRTTDRQRFEDAITTYALCIHSFKIAQHWYPNPHISATLRNDFFREVDILIVLVKGGILSPWKMLAEWFNTYETFAPLVWNSAARRAIDTDDNKYAIYRFTRNMANQLTDDAKVKLQRAEEEMKQLCAKLGVENFENKLERRLAGVRRAVEQDCKDNGCLHLREILADHQAMVKTARFSRRWRYD